MQPNGRSMLHFFRFARPCTNHMSTQPEYNQDDGLHIIEHGGENPTVEFVTPVPDKELAKLILIY